MKRICIYVALGVLGAFSAHAQEINIGQTVARKISDDKVEVSFVWIAARCVFPRAGRW